MTTLKGYLAGVQKILLTFRILVGKCHWTPVLPPKWTLLNNIGLIMARPFLLCQQKGPLITG